ncbi:MAG: alanine racemase [Candidatus Protistobacter heckmanni]|nr:alanine racemase [Candidatus Protistobacter heckmanni]
MPRPIRAVIRTQALASNLSLVRQYAKQSRIWSVVKANAYGHGLQAAWRGLAATDGFALLEVFEGVRLREFGWQGPVLLLEGVFDAADLELARRHGFTIAVHKDEQIDLLAAAAGPGKTDIYLKMNSGMNRLGFAPAAYAAAYARLRALPQVGEIVLMTHFANADAPDRKGIAGQLGMFESTVGALDRSLSRSLSNSGAILQHPEAHYDWVRPGIILYGAAPSGKSKEIAGLGLKPVMSLESRIIAVQQLRAGDTVGYGSRFAAPRAMRIGVVACGYADGYPRHAPDGCSVLVEGVRVPMVGQVSMDMICVDLESVPQAGLDSAVELWGENLPVDDVAEAARTVGYELLCAVTPRVPVSVV